jgi:hypothetical protein
MIAVEMVGIQVDPEKIITQKLASSNRACLPTCFLNALKFGPTSFQRIFSALPGASDEDKLNSVIDIFASEPSDVRRGARRFESGVVSDDSVSGCNSILLSKDQLAGAHLDMLRGEQPYEHLHRIHGLLVGSLEPGFPIIATVSAYAATHRKEEFVWSRIAEHSILIVRVPKEIAHNAYGFVFYFIEPAKGELCEGYIHSETIREFRAIKSSSPGYNYNEKERKFVVMKGLSDRWIDNGFLQIVSPSLLLKTYNEPWYVRTFFTLSHATGKFSAAQLRNTVQTPPTRKTEGVR